MNQWVRKGEQNPDRWMEKHPNWTGGRRVDPNGYVRLQLGFKKERYEHRVLMEEILARPLTFDEVVHHIDGDKSNNSLENLQLMSRSEHTSLERERLVSES